MDRKCVRSTDTLGAVTVRCFRVKVAIVRGLMQTTLRRWVLFGLSLVGRLRLSAGMLGCDQGCDVDATCVPRRVARHGIVDDGCPADPADGPVRPDCGIWVSASRGQDSSPGTQESPVQTLAQAIVLAQAGPKRVYACGETYAEPVRLPSGVSLFGGFDCRTTGPMRACRSGRRSLPFPVTSL